MTPDPVAAKVGERLPPPGAPLTAIYTPLRRMAEAGNAAAACRLAFDLNECRMRDTRGKSSELFKRPSTGKADPMSEKAQKRAAQRESTCAGFPVEETVLAWDFALASAQAGNRHARLMVVRSPVGLDMMRPENTLEGWMEWRREAPSILEAGVREGDPVMFRLAAGAYSQVFFGGRLFPEDRDRALAHLLALRGAVAPTYRAAFEREIEQVSKSWIKADPGLLQRAEALARSLPPVRPAQPGGFDWSNGIVPSEDGSPCEGP